MNAGNDLPPTIASVAGNVQASVVPYLYIFFVLIFYLKAAHEYRQRPALCCLCDWNRARGCGYDRPQLVGVRRVRGGSPFYRRCGCGARAGGCRLHRPQQVDVMRMQAAPDGC